jgi:predicted ATPase
MFLRKLRLSNIRSVKEMEISFADGDGTPRQWTFLLGENGTGKSTLLRAIALVLAGSDALPELIAHPDGWVREGASAGEVSAELATADGDERPISFTIRRKDTLSDLFKRNQAAMEAIDRAIARAPRNYFTVGYGASRRLARAASLERGEEFKTPRSQTVATLFSPDAILRPLAGWALDLHYQHGARGLAAIRQTLDGLLPGVSFKRIDRKKRALIFETPDGDVPIDRLSDGYQNVAAWCGDLMYRIVHAFGNYRDPLSARGLLLIDEIDLHLHPVWQRQLRSFLTDKLPHFQIVATTHSPLTAQQAGTGELWTLHRPGPNLPPAVHQFTGEPRKLMVHQLLLSPVFGVETVDSRSVERERKEYRSLRNAPKKSPQQKQRLAQLQDMLRDLPDWVGTSPDEKRQQRTLDQIKSLLTPPAARGRRTAARRGRAAGGAA